jgi:hypothetical protein
LVQSAFVADAYAAAVVGAAVGAYFEQSAVFGYGAVSAYVEVVPYGSESAFPVVSSQLFHRVVGGFFGGGAVQDQEAYGVCSRHVQAAFLSV